MGLTLRDAHTVNSIEEDAPVPNGGPAFLKARSEFTFRDIVSTLEPLCKAVQGPPTVVGPSGPSSPGPSATGPGPTSTSAHVPSLGIQSPTSALTSLPPTVAVARSSRLRTASRAPVGRRSPSAEDSAEEVEKQVDDGMVLNHTEGDEEPQSMSEQPVAQRPTQTRLRQPGLTPIASSAVARHTRGRQPARRRDTSSEPTQVERPTKATRRSKAAGSSKAAAPAGARRSNRTSQKPGA